MPYFDKCPRCNSDNVTGNRKRNEAHCDDCGYPDEGTFAGSAQEVSCCELAESGLWVDEVVDFWPGPIAHEYRRLRELLRRGQIVGAVWKLKDMAEMLTRFPACVMACDVLANSSDAEFKAKVRTDLLGRIMTMGGWHEFASNIALHMLKNPGTSFICSSLPTLFHDKKAKGKYAPSELNKLLGELTKWRNSDFAHGALRLNFGEFIKDLNEYLPRLHTSLAAFNAINGWHDCILLAEDGTRFIGAASIQDQHLKQHRGHDVLRIPLKLRSGNRELSLDPYAQLRRCDECHRQDIFLFDWRSARRNGRDQYRFIDYLAGHHIESPWWRETDLDKEVGHLDATVISGTTSDDVVLDQDLTYLAPEIERLLTDCSTSKHYEIPVYLRKDLARFVRSQAKGTWWLKAPGHVGKSTFIGGIDPKLAEHYGGSPLVDDLCIVVFYIRREYQNGVGQLSERLYFAISETLGIRTGPGGRPVRQLDIDSSTPAHEFAAWLGEFMKVAQLTGRSRKLLICIDGLDELPKPETGQSCIADFLPPPESLPEGVYLALTSRPDNELPAWLLTRLKSSQAQATVKSIGLADKDYVRLMYVYFKKRLAHRIDQALENKPEQTREKIADLKPLFDESLIRSGGRFLYLGYIVDRLADGTLTLDGLRKLPPDEHLFEHFFDEIKRIHQGSNLDDYFERVLLHLVAAEQTFRRDRDSLPEVAREATWLGLPIDVLSRRIDPRPNGGVTVKLAYALYTLKPVLGTWRGGTEGLANYRIGLRGLDELVGRRYVERLKNLHASLVDGLIRQFGPVESGINPDLDKDMQLRLRYVAVHAQIGGIPMVEAMESYAIRLADSQMEYANAEKDNSRLFSSTRWYSASIAFREMLRAQFSKHWPTRVANDLAVAYRSRGTVRLGAGDIRGAATDFGVAITLHEAMHETASEQMPPEFINDWAAAIMDRGATRYLAYDATGAIADYDMAIALRETLREQLGEQWPATLGNSLALAYMNRGSAKEKADDKAGALADFDTAIALRCDLSERPDAQYLPKQVNYLSMAYGNRGAARVKFGDVIGAISDYNTAIEIREALRERVGEQWPPNFANDLAWVYSKRGVLRKSAGDLLGAISDYNAAIALGETVRNQLGDQWPASFANVLAAAYGNRGFYLKSSGNGTAAITDYNNAIEIREAQRMRLGEQWPPNFAYDLVWSYAKRGDHRKSSGDVKGAIGDYDAAIERGESLRKQFGEQCPSIYIDTLVCAYMKRALARNSTDDATGAICDHNTAIVLGETSRKHLGEQWHPKLTHSLIVAYWSRGLLNELGGNLSGATFDFSTAISLGVTMREQLGEQWTPVFANTLLSVYLARARTLRSAADIAGALSDYNAAVETGEALRERRNEKWPPKFSRNLVEAYKNRGRLLLKTGDREGAEVDFSRAKLIQNEESFNSGSQHH